MKNCWYDTVVGTLPVCEHKCEACSWYLEDPEWPEDKDEKDDLIE